MTGRYGADELGRTLNIVVLVSLVVSMFSGLLPVLSVFYWFGIALMIYNCFRMFSKNVSKRYEENQRYLSRRYKAVGIVTAPILAVLAFAFSAALFLGTLIIGDRRARTELRRRFHVR